MAVPQEVHSMIDDDVGAWPTHQMGDRIGVNDSRGREEIPSRLHGRTVARRGWSPFVVKIVEAAEGVDNIPLEKRKERFRLPQKPVPVARERDPLVVRRLKGKINHGDC